MSEQIIKCAFNAKEVKKLKGRGNALLSHFKDTRKDNAVFSMAPEPTSGKMRYVGISIDGVPSPEDSIISANFVADIGNHPTTKILLKVLAELGINSPCIVTFEHCSSTHNELTLSTYQSKIVRHLGEYGSFECPKYLMTVATGLGGVLYTSTNGPVPSGKFELI